MSKPTQNFKLYQLLKSGEEVLVKTIADTLGVKVTAVPVYIHALKKKFGAEIEGIRVKHAVVTYKLTNPKEIQVPEGRTDNAYKPSKKIVKDPEPPVVVAEEQEVSADSVDEIEPLEPEDPEVTERVIQDLRSEFGLDNRGHGADE